MTEPNQSKTPVLTVIMGVSGCGKTTVANAVSKACDLGFIEADDLHSSEAKAMMASGIALQDTDREPWIHAICTLVKTFAGECRSVVLACSALKAKHRQRFREIGIPVLFVFLDGTQQTIKARINNREGHFFPSHLLASQFEALERPDNEQDVCPIAIDAPVDEISDKAVQAVSRFMEEHQ